MILLFLIGGACEVLRIQLNTYVIANLSGKYTATCKRSSTIASRDSATIETTSGVHDKSLDTQRKSALQIHGIELGTVIKDFRRFY